MPVIQVCRIPDALLLGCVCLNASLSIVRKDYGDFSTGALVLSWYALAALYVGLAWLGGAIPCMPGWGCRLIRVGLVLGVALSVGILVGLAFEGLSSLPVRWFDWMALGLCFVLRALGGRAIPRPQ
jgi:hypothetical protein